MARPRSCAPTQTTIAEAVGVSVPTVSKALRDDPTISKRTRALVHATASRLGYTSPASSASSGATSSPSPDTAPTPHTRHRVSIVCDTINNAYTGELLAGMLAAARTLDVILQIDHLGVAADVLDDEDSAEQAASALARLATGNADALILVTTPVDSRTLERSLERGQPILAIDPATTPPAGLVTLAATNWRGGVQATEHLIGLGHRRIGVICGPQRSLPTIERLAGFRHACSAADIEPDDSLILPGRYDYESGLEAGGALLDLAEPPTAIFAMNDVIAVGVLEAARRRNVHVPEDLSVIGFDDTSVARMSSPRLTVIRQPLHEIGSEAVHAVVRALGRGRVSGSPIEMQTSLVTRSSTAPAPR
ncbi:MULTISPECIES: LacI family DNA-binding transcriptional regulator [Actinomyces]|uniref:LacI family DNA-binding transcriptional regulator n=1 Tax=Actinomyces respiraculi TaxID=2744574 RepID=A0A7T0LJT7_9ACTO|nr:MULTISPECIES: LacI family DNA-binding transcriptional regulator [Actinomyces]QPL05077.1 LacI family DNA-binding transcriptional regulator [Actinomyces respiraculi]